PTPRRVLLVSFGSRGDPPCDLVTLTFAVFRSGGPQLSRSRPLHPPSVRRLPARRVCVLAAYKKEHYGSGAGASNRPPAVPPSPQQHHHCRSVKVFWLRESAPSRQCDARLRGGSPRLMVGLTGSFCLA